VNPSDHYVGRTRLGHFAYRGKDGQDSVSDLTRKDMLLATDGREDVRGPGAGALLACAATGTAAEPSTTRLPGLDGLRALAVIAVLLYHAEIPGIPGGYLGVEVFFVLSGYLITSLLLTEADHAQGRIDLTRFWMRRARRLLPAMFFMVGVVVGYAVLFLPEELAELRGQLVAALVYGTNWYFILSEQSYFEALGRPPLLQHLWSLAVEEQFYLVWPPLMAVGVRWLNRPSLSTVCLLGALASVLYAGLLYVPDADPSRLYYGTDTRAGGLLVGAALACGYAPPHLVPDRTTIALDALAGLALIALGLQFATTPETDPYLYRGKLLLCGLTTAAIIAVAVHPSARLGRLLDAWPLRVVGVRSYGLYLWHWPIFMVTRPELDIPLNGTALLLLRLGLTFAIAELSFRFIETPIRAGALARTLATLRAYGPEPRLRWAGVGASALSVSLVALTVWLGVAVAGAKPAPLPEDLIASTTVETLPPSEVPGTTALQPGNALPPRAESSQELSPISAAVAAAASVSEPAATGITAVVQPTSTPETAPPPPAAEPSGPPAPPRQILAVGDSVMLDAASELRAVLGPSAVIDALVGRQVVAGIRLLRAHEAAGRLGNTVLLHLGNNGTFTPEQFDEIMTVLGPDRTAIFVTVKVPRRWQRSVNETLRASVERYRHALLIDWDRHSATLRGAFGRDGVHLRPKGRRIYAQLIRERLSGL
jgi:peptidoglycan/LPS O-acetylase OafA/YrhL